MPDRPKVHRPQPPMKRVQIARPRGTTTQRGYGHRWQVLRAWWIRNNPICVHCEKEGRIVAAEEVDHVIPHNGDEALLYSETNLMSLCAVHHRRKTARQILPRK